MYTRHTGTCLHVLARVNSVTYPSTGIHTRFTHSSHPLIPPTHPTRSPTDMKVWIDQDLCTGDGLCEEIAPDVFTLLDDGLAYVVEGDKIFAEATGNAQRGERLAEIPDRQLEAGIECAEGCPGEGIYLEP